jgi:hypothetical protein
MRGLGPEWVGRAIEKKIKIIISILIHYKKQETNNHNINLL